MFSNFSYLPYHDSSAVYGYPSLHSSYHPHPSRPISSACTLTPQQTARLAQAQGNPALLSPFLTSGGYGGEDIFFEDGLTPRQRTYLQAKREQEMMEREQRLRRAAELRRRQEEAAAMSRREEERTREEELLNRRLFLQEQERSREIEREQQMRGTGLYDYGLSPSRQAYLEVKRRREALEKERLRLAAEQENILQAEQRLIREEEALERHLRQEEEEGRLRERVNVQTPPSRMASKSPSRPQPQAHSQTPLQEAAKAGPSAPLRPLPTEEQITAASTIHRFYRIRKALAAITTLSRRFEALKASFQFPARVDFEAGGETVAVDASMVATSAATNCEESTGGPRLAYTPANAPIHAYEDALSQIVTALDGIESWGSQEVRQKRREVVRMVESESGRVEELWRSTWRRHISSMDAKMESIEEPVPTIIDPDESLSTSELSSPSLGDRNKPSSSEDDVPTSELIVASPVHRDVEHDAGCADPTNQVQLRPLEQPTPEDVPISVPQKQDGSTKGEKEVQATNDEDGSLINRDSRIVDDLDFEML